MNRTLKNVLLVGLTLVVPGAGLAWLIKIAKSDPDKDFKRYVEHRFNKMKAEEQPWLQ